MTKRQLAQKRNYFKYVLSGIPKPIDFNALSEEEVRLWTLILNTRSILLESFEAQSSILGLRIPEHKCWCGKEAKYTLDSVVRDESATWVCKKHKEE